MLIGIDIRGIEQVRQKLQSLASPQLARAATKATADYLRGQLQRYPPQIYVSRREAYGRPFESARQRRWFFAALRDGTLRIPYQRTGTLRRGWRILESGGADHILVNEVPYARFVQNSPQARMMTLRQWRTLQRIIYEERDRIKRVIDEAVNAAIKKLKR